MAVVVVVMVLNSEMVVAWWAPKTGYVAIVLFIQNHCDVLPHIVVQ